MVGLSSGEADSNDNLHTTSLDSQDILSSEEATLDNDNAANTPSNNALSPSMKRRTRECNVWFLALRDDEPFKKLLGQWGDASSFHFPRSYLVSSNSEQNKMISNGEATPEMISFRAQVSRLPFAIRFQLERILLDNSIIPIQHEEQPEEARDELRQEIAINARRLVFNFVEHVLPPLLEMEWEVDVDNFTLSELFALAIEADLRAAKEAVKEGKSINFGDNAIIRAMEQANDWLVKAERVCRSNEPQLAVDYGSFDINILKRRAMWPIADYKCKFTINGDLIPADYIIPALMAQTYTTESRRGQREGGWLVRDRFCCISKIETGEPFRSEMVGWLRNEPMMVSLNVSHLIGGVLSLCLFFREMNAKIRFL